MDRSALVVTSQIEKGHCVPVPVYEASELMLLRRCTYAGRPFGEQEYVAIFEERFGRVWWRWGFEKESEVRTFAG